MEPAPKVREIVQDSSQEKDDNPNVIEQGGEEELKNKNKEPEIAKVFHLKRKSASKTEKSEAKSTFTSKSQSESESTTGTETISMGINDPDKPLKLWPIKKELIVNIFDNIGKPILSLEIDPRYWPKNLQSPETIHKMDYERTCELKQGYVALGPKTTLPNGKIGLKLKPAFAVLNKQTLSFFDAENVNSLRESIETSILDNDQKSDFFEKVNCFQLIIKKSSSSQSQSTLKGKVMCMDTKESYNAWVQAVQKFRNCEVSEYESENGDGPTIKVTTKRVIDGSSESSDSEMNEKYYSSMSDHEDHTEQEEMEEELKKIEDELACKAKEQEKTRIRIEEEKKKLERKTRLMHERAECIEEALKAKAFEEENMAENLFKQESFQKRKNMFRKTKEEISKEKREEEKRVLDIKYQLEEAERQIQEQVKNSLITEVLNFQKILDPSNCYDMKLRGGNEKQIKKVCGSLLEPGKAPDLKLLINCMNPKHFCQICCNENIGEAYEEKRLKCKTRCFDTLFKQDSLQNNWVITYNQEKKDDEKDKKGKANQQNESGAAN